VVRGWVGVCMVLTSRFLWFYYIRWDSGMWSLGLVLVVGGD
jgi:hypothetical protein